MDTFHGISFHLTFTVAPENANEFLKRFGPIVDLVAAEPECEYFEVFQSPEQPGRFRVVEHWSKDKDWFMKYQYTKPYYKTFDENVLPLLVEERKIEFFDRLPGSWTKT